MSQTVIDILLAQMNRLETKIDTLMNSGCSKASMHDAFEQNQKELFERINKIEVSSAECGTVGKFAKFFDSLLKPWPWMFASIAVFSPNFPAILETIKGFSK